MKQVGELICDVVKGNKPGNLETAKAIFVKAVSMTEMSSFKKELKAKLCQGKGENISSRVFENMGTY